VRLWLTVFLVAVLTVLVVLNSRDAGLRQRGVFATDPPSPYFHFSPGGSERQKVLVVHGLNANKEVMNLLCLGLSDAGFDVYSMDLPGHGDSEIPFNAVIAGNAVKSALDSLGPDTLVIGHSLGATLVLDVANDRPLPSVVLLSPAPTPLDQVRSDRILVLTGQFDLPRIPQFVPRIEDAAGTGDFRKETIPWSGHSAFAFRPQAIRTIVAWLGGDPSVVRTERRLVIAILELAILVAIPWVWLSREPAGSTVARWSLLLLGYIAASTAAFFVSAIVVVLRFLHLFATDYLISFVFLAGMALLPASLRKAPMKLANVYVGGLSALYVIAAAVFIVSEHVHLTVSDGRWWRFLVMTIALVPLSFSDEVFLRPIRPWWKAAGVLRPCMTSCWRMPRRHGLERPAH